MIDNLGVSEMANQDTIERLRIDLQLPLLIQRGSRGMLACGYINVATTNKTGEACAIVRGVNSFDDMLAAKVVEVSDQAKQLGVQEGMTGQEALELFC
ncbi:MAG: YunC family protein [Pirellulaceae bacterium]|nr:YunC family protein [Pirellulaceae bacterium]